jgi:hypothetical protein
VCVCVQCCSHCSRGAKKVAIVIKIRVIQTDELACVPPPAAALFSPEGTVSEE